MGGEVVAIPCDPNSTSGNCERRPVWPGAALLTLDYGTRNRPAVVPEGKKIPRPAGDS